MDEFKNIEKPIKKKKKSFKNKEELIAKKEIKISWPGGMIHILPGDDCMSFSEKIKDKLRNNNVI